MHNAGMASQTLHETKRLHNYDTAASTDLAEHLGRRCLCCRATKEEVKQVTEKVKPPRQDPTKTPEP